MTDEQIKEQLAFYLFCLLASRQGCKIKTSLLADGADLEFEPTYTYVRVGKSRHFSLGKTIEVQLKTTTTSRVAVQNDSLKYDLDAKNFDDLIFRAGHRKLAPKETTPLILVLLVLPEDEDHWILIPKAEKQFQIGGEMFWYVPPPDADFSEKKFSRRILIPLENRVNLDFFFNIFNQIYQ
ncbi:MAG: DUF4365 domain-containing protein [Planctomycetota bacterium]